jgi:hypothetical protein
LEGYIIYGEIRSPVNYDKIKISTGVFYRPSLTISISTLNTSVQKSII